MKPETPQSLHDVVETEPSPANALIELHAKTRADPVDLELPARLVEPPRVCFEAH